MYCKMECIWKVLPSKAQNDSEKGRGKYKMYVGKNCKPWAYNYVIMFSKSKLETCSVTIAFIFFLISQIDL